MSRSAKVSMSPTTQIPRSIVYPECPGCGEEMDRTPLSPGAGVYRICVPHHRYGEKPCRVAIDIYPSGLYRAWELSRDVAYEEALIRGVGTTNVAA